MLVCWLIAASVISVIVSGVFCLFLFCEIDDEGYDQYSDWDSDETDVEAIDDVEDQELGEQKNGSKKCADVAICLP
ncbi:hypothetical protein L596_015715 [Steinernema carpocapsae]|uniref:Uncharacterized protein n=1 Tax=Steinernema carpocapsae TaxID=34508 RepID=A0A4U5NFS8_STECR|nr:hypothetical protein L596_015715 [Steinernema carpocapsae]